MHTSNRNHDRSVRAAALAVVVALTSVACGTTLPLAEQAGSPVVLTDPDTGEQVVVQPEAGQLDPLGPAVAAPGMTDQTARDPQDQAIPGSGRSPSPQSPGSGSGSPSPSTSPGGGPTPGGGPVPPAQGVTDDQINLGITLFEVGGFGEAIGSDLSYGDTEQQAQAVVDWINANGGIAGRQVNPIYYTLDFSRVAEYDQEACARWTEDNKVFAALNTVLSGQPLLHCLAERGVPGVHHQMPVDEQVANQFHSFYYNNGMPTIDRRVRFQVDALGELGYFDGKTVGLMYLNEPAYQRIIDELFVPLLEQHGAAKVVLQAAPLTGAQEAQVAVARFQREGVTHVSFLGEAGLYPLFFMRSAENQLYRPQYFLNTDHQPLTLQSAAPPAQLQNVTGHGWLQALDVDDARDPGPISSSNELCLQIQREAGQNMSERGARYTAELYCEGLFWFKTVLDAAPTLSVEAMEQTVDALGASYQSAVTFAATYGPGRHDAPSAYRDFVFECATAACDSGYFTYTSQTKPMP